MYETADAKKYKKDFIKHIKEQALLQQFIFLNNKTQHYYCDCVFYFGRIDQDCNNYFKLLLDAITESNCVWIDDNIVCERVNAIYYDSENPRIEIDIYPVNYIGIFNNQEQLDKFKSNCIQCKRYREGRCSILIKSLEGRIQPEIENYTCKQLKTKEI